jgi:hypothetical protein
MAQWGLVRSVRSVSKFIALLLPSSPIPSNKPAYIDLRTNGTICAPFRNQHVRVSGTLQLIGCKAEAEELSDGKKNYPNREGKEKLAEIRVIALESAMQ